MDVFINFKTPKEDVDELLKRIRDSGYKAHIDWNVYIIRTDAPFEFFEKLYKDKTFGIQSFSNIVKKKGEKNDRG